jgi:lysyl-tRNA synthetase class 2
MTSSAKLESLEKRADLLYRLRAFFHAHGFLEVETPLVSDEVIPELHIEPLRLENGQFLQASPELSMKRLVAAWAKAIFQVTHSFRAGERGKLHSPEFTIVEWYRVGDGMRTGMALVDDLMQSLLQTPPAIKTSYCEAFEKHAGINPHTATLEQLATRLEAPVGLDRTNRDEWLNLILSECVEPQLGGDRPEIIYHYPASQAALAQTTIAPDGYEVAERFELYYRGVELANGYHELGDAMEQRHRFEAVNSARDADGRPALPLPESLLAAIEKGLPDCTGVALGFDRLAMLATGASSIGDVLTFSNEN